VAPWHADVLHPDLGQVVGAGSPFAPWHSGVSQPVLGQVVGGGEPVAPWHDDVMHPDSGHTNVWPAAATVPAAALVSTLADTSWTPA
jgi:hypothetical protein